uniref:Protein kinase domain-containing protein n=1 Tax=Oryza punctata TaxID=4537 RepID=A0A0E0KNY3_ORYPU
MHFAIANLTCKEAQQNTTRYACVSVNSTCLAVNDDVHQYPAKKEYDDRTKRCTPVKRQKNLLPGIVIGLSSVFGILLLGLSTRMLIHKWKKDIQKRVRRKNFRKNEGLLLEQLISSDETTTDRMNIFTLDELEKATNNFDHTRILGQGGHGTVYKGILSDQRVVAIKKSMTIKQELLLMKEPIITSENGSKLNLAGYFLEEVKVKPSSEIVTTQVYQEATEEQIKNVTLLAEMCLRPQGEERPTMKQVEMALQSLRAEESNRCHVAQGNDQEQPLLLTRVEASFESTMAVHHANASAQQSQRCYSIEQEFIASAELPR